MHSADEGRDSFVPVISVPGVQIHPASLVAVAGTGRFPGSLSDKQQQLELRRRTREAPLCTVAHRSDASLSHAFRCGGRHWQIFYS